MSIIHTLAHAPTSGASGYSLGATRRTLQHALQLIERAFDFYGGVLFVFIVLQAL